MRRSISRPAALVLLLLVSACRREAAAPVRPGPPAVPHLVLAFYYPWYGRPDGPSGKWYHWNPATPRHNSTDTPVLGWYDSNDTVVVRQHVRWAKAAGIDGFISSWWGPTSFEDRSLRVLLRVAEQEGFRVTALVEHPVTRDQLRDDFHTLLAGHATSPAWLRARGRPVVLFYDRVMQRFGPDDFRAAFEGTSAFTLADTFDPAKAAPFDGVFAYGPVQDVPAYLRDEPATRDAHHAAGRIFVASAVPGYDDRVIRQPGRFLDRAGGALYRSMWDAAAGAEWVTVTSWNEWHEGTEVEPSTEYGTSFLELTRALAGEWRGR